MTRMNRDDAEFLKQAIADETAHLVKRIEALEEKINWVTETDWAAIGRQQRAEPGYCTCGRHASDQCDFCKRHTDGATLSSQDRGTQ